MVPPAGIEPAPAHAGQPVLRRQRLPLRHGGLVGLKGFEPPRLSAPDSKSGASTSFATGPYGAAGGTRTRKHPILRRVGLLLPHSGMKKIGG